MLSGVWRWWSSSCSLQPVVALLLLAVLWWSEPKAGGDGASATPSIKLTGFSLDLSSVALFLSPPSHRGGGLEEKLQDDVVVADSMEGQPGAAVLPRAHHMVTKFVAMICGKKR